MNLNAKIRQLHRWLSIIFSSIVAAIFLMLGLGQEPPNGSISCRCRRSPFSC